MKGFPVITILFAPISGLSRQNIPGSDSGISN